MEESCPVATRRAASLQPLQLPAAAAASASDSLAPFLLASTAAPLALMSNKKNDDEGSVASRTRRQTRIRAREEEEEKEQPAAPSSSHVSPAMRIYRHALESIFAMLELSDLSSVLAVSRAWAENDRQWASPTAGAARVCLMPAPAVPAFASRTVDSNSVTSDPACCDAQPGYDRGDHAAAAADARIGMQPARRV